LDVALSEFMSVTMSSQVDRWRASKASMTDLPVDGATVGELEKVKLLRSAILHSLGSSSALEGWEASFLLQATLVRYLRGRNGDIKAAEVMLLDSLEWFREQRYWEDWLRKHEVEDSPQHKALFRKYGAEGPFGLDKLGVPVLYVRAGLQDTVGMIRETSVEVYVRHLVWNLEDNCDKHYLASVKVGKAVIGSVMVLDLQGMTWGQAQENMGMLIWFLDNVLKDRFPEFIRALYVINVPWFFRMGWHIVSPFIPEETKEKMLIFRSGYLPRLQEHVDLQQIPAFLGGTSRERWPHGEGGDVPDSGGANANETFIVDILAGKSHSIDVEVAPGSTCMWEFCVERYAIDYNISIKDEAVQPLKRVTHANGWLTIELEPRDVPRHMVFLLDNRHSWFRRKRLFYRIFLGNISVVSRSVGVKVGETLTDLDKKVV